MPSCFTSSKSFFKIKDLFSINSIISSAVLGGIGFEFNWIIFEYFWLNWCWSSILKLFHIQFKFSFKCSIILWKMPISVGRAKSYFKSAIWFPVRLCTNFLKSMSYSAHSFKNKETKVSSGALPKWCFLMSFNLSLVKYLNDTSIIVPLTLGKFAERLVIVIGNFGWWAAT